jgi:class 3 adenylate cyclase/tetratricopeptide (TPR) repeat protein
VAQSTDLVAIVSTDWVESTATRTQIGEERADQLQREHDKLLRDAVAEFGGTIVKNSGDGMLATFHSATDAVGAAVRAQQRAASYSLSAKALAPIAMRVGVSVGDVVHQEGDIFGTPIIEAVRLQSAAEPGQVLCSDLVRVLARGRGGFTFDFIGMLELKGLPEPVPACAVQWESDEEFVAEVPLPPELRTEGSRFVGRDEELHTATELLLSGQRAQALWLLGEPGIGKTRLAAEIANRAFDAGALVLFGRCDQDVAAPFEPVIQALRWYVVHASDDELHVIARSDAESLTRLVPELRDRRPDLPVPAGVTTDAEQYRLFESVRSFVAARAAQRPVVWVVDDAHWADRPTLTLLAHVLRGAHDARILVIGTARDTAPDASVALANMVDELDVAGRGSQVRLEGLNVEQIGVLVAGIEGAGDDALAERLAAETAGNPLFVSAVLAALNVSGAPAANVAELPADVRSAVRRRVRRLSPPAQDLLQVAAVVGLEFPLGVVADVVAVDESTALGLVEDAVAAGLTHETSVDRFRFTHALVRDALHRELSASRRARVHIAVARAIEARYPDALDEHAAALARHYSTVGDEPSTRKALDYAARAAERSLDLLAFDSAVEDYDSAVALAEQLGLPPAERFQLLSAKGRAQLLAGTHMAAVATLSNAADVGREAGDWRGFAEAAIAFEAANWRRGALGHESLMLLREARMHEDDLPVPTRIVLAASFARALHYAGRIDEASRLAEDALVEAARIGDVEARAHALAASVQVRVPFGRDDLDVVIERAEELVSLESVLADTEPVGDVAEYAFVASITAGNPDEAATWHERFKRVYDRGGWRFSRFVLLCGEQILAFMHGDLEQAEALADRSAEFGRETGEDVSGVNGVQMFLLRREQDRLRELTPVVRMFLASNPEALLWRPGLALLLAEIGMHDEARRNALALSRDDLADLPYDNLFPSACCFLAETAMHLGEAEVAAVVERRLERWSGLGITLGSFVGHLGAADRYLGLAAWCRGDRGLADARFGAALEWNRRMRADLWVAHTLVDRAALRYELGDDESATIFVREARVIADAHGLAAVAHRAEVLATR